MNTATVRATCAALCLALSLGACGAPAQSSEEQAPKEETSTAQEGQTAQSASMPNPFVEAKSIEELATVAGFGISFPESIEGFGEPSYMSAIPQELAQVKYGSGEPSVLLRKGPAGGTENISGMYVNYGEERTVDMEGTPVKMSGQDGQFLVAVWTRDGYDYAITASDFLEQDALLQIASQMG